MLTTAIDLPSSLIIGLPRRGSLFIQLWVQRWIKWMSFSIGSLLLECIIRIKNDSNAPFVCILQSARTCPHCCDIFYRFSRVAPCSHVFCLECLVAYYASRIEGVLNASFGSSAPCPVCQSSWKVNFWFIYPFITFCSPYSSETFELLRYVKKLSVRSAHNVNFNCFGEVEYDSIIPSQHLNLEQICVVSRRWSEWIYWFPITRLSCRAVLKSQYHDCWRIRGWNFPGWWGYVKCRNCRLSLFMITLALERCN